MFSFETVVSAGYEAEQVTAAFYRFLKMRSVPFGAETTVQIEVMGEKRKYVVRLWSAQACEEFRIYLNRFELPAPMKLSRQFGPSKSSDL